MQPVDFENWERKGHYEFFQRMDYPQFNICMNIDVTNLLKFTKKHNISFYYSMIYYASMVINQIDNFKYRIRDGQVVLLDKIHPSYTDMGKEDKNDLFKLITLELVDNLFEFEKTARETNEKQTEHFRFGQLLGRDDLIFITCIPWISFTHVSHTITLNRCDAIPRISWGKYFRQGRKTMLPFSVQANHSFVDGYHIGKYSDLLQGVLHSIEL